MIYNEYDVAVFSSFIRYNKGFYNFSNSWLRYRFFVSPATYPKFYSPLSPFSVSLPIVLCQLSFSMLFSLSFSLSLFLSLFFNVIPLWPYLFLSLFSVSVSLKLVAHLGLGAFREDNNIMGNIKEIENNIFNQQ